MNNHFIQINLSKNYQTPDDLLKASIEELAGVMIREGIGYLEKSKMDKYLRLDFFRYPPDPRHQEIHERIKEAWYYLNKEGYIKGTQGYDTYIINRDGCRERISNQIETGNFETTDKGKEFAVKTQSSKDRNVL